MCWEDQPLYAIALLCSGQSSTITGTCAGQYIMQIVLLFQLPFALIPLLKFSIRTTKMGPHKNSKYITVISWILGIGLMGINIYFLSTSFFGWMIHSSLPKVATVFIGIIVFPLMAIYVIGMVYLVFRKDTVVTFIEPTKLEIGQIKKEDTSPGSDQVPYRVDLAEIPVPE